MDNARKDELECKFIINKKTDTKALKNLEIQELIFLIDSAQYFKKTKAFDADFDEKIEIIRDLLIDRIKLSGMLFTACSKNSEYPYIDKEDRALLFSDKECAKKAFASFDDENKPVIKVMGQEELKEQLLLLYRCGIKKMLIDKGGYEYELECDELMAHKKFSLMEEESGKLMNPHLMHACIKYSQSLQENPQDKSEMNMLEMELYNQIVQSKYIVPVSKEKEAEEVTNEEIPFGTVKDAENKEYIAVFTDMDEFEKTFDKDRWNVHILTYSDIKIFVHKENGFVINLLGLPIFVDERNKEEIDKMEAAMIKAEEIKKQVEKEQMEKSKTKILAPQKYPLELVHALKKCMRRNKEINKAYLREVSKNDDVSYLVVVEQNGDEGEIFKDILNAALPHLNGKNIDVVDINSEFGTMATENVEPFYKKKLLDYFMNYGKN